jgi:hypothetical protein
MEVIIDRFETDWAVVTLKNGTTVDMPRILLPDEAKEGDVIVIRIDRARTGKLRQEVDGLMKDVWAD